MSPGGSAVSIRSRSSNGWEWDHVVKMAQWMIVSIHSANFMLANYNKFSKFSQSWPHRVFGFPQMSHHHHYRRSNPCCVRTIVARGRNQKHEIKLIEKLVFSKWNAWMCAHSLVATGGQWATNGLRSSKNENGRKLFTCGARVALDWPLLSHCAYVVCSGTLHFICMETRLKMLHFSIVWFPFSTSKRGEWAKTRLKIADWV